MDEEDTSRDNDHSISDSELQSYVLYSLYIATLIVFRV